MTLGGVCCVALPIFYEMTGWRFSLTPHNKLLWIVVHSANTLLVAGAALLCAAGAQTLRTTFLLYQPPLCVTLCPGEDRRAAARPEGKEDLLPCRHRHSALLHSSSNGVMPSAVGSTLLFFLASWDSLEDASTGQPQLPSEVLIPALQSPPSSRGQHPFPRVSLQCTPIVRPSSQASAVARLGSPLSLSCFPTALGWADPLVTASVILTRAFGPFSSLLPDAQFFILSSLCPSQPLSDTGDRAMRGSQAGPARSREPFSPDEGCVLPGWPVSGCCRVCPSSTEALFCHALWLQSGSHFLRVFWAEMLPLAVFWMLLFIGVKSAESPTSTGGLESGGLTWSLQSSRLHLLSSRLCWKRSSGVVRAELCAPRIHMLKC